MSTAAEKCARTIALTTDTVTMASAPASAVTVVTIVQVAPAGELPWPRSLPQPQVPLRRWIWEKTAVMRFAIELYAW